MKREITKLPMLPEIPSRKRVCGYARVSSGKDEMLHSLAAQVSYYSNLIQSKPEWIYVGVYADEAETGTKDDRPEFMRLLADCRAGKIDLIITKSISRFARNTVTLLETVRELKSLSIGVFFEEQNIYSLSGDGELMLSILASYAQEESRSASENQKWRVKRNFEDGKPWSSKIFGYRYEKGKFIIIPEEAEIVRRIYEDYLSGLGVMAIAKALSTENVLTRNGNNQWNKSSVETILKNYNYTGNLLLQKTYNENHITKRRCVNHGEMPQYHAESTHEPIISLDMFNAVRGERERRARKFKCKQVPRKTYAFTGLLVCNHCGKHYRRKTTKTGIVWICTTFNSLGKSYCPSKQIPETTLTEIASEFDDIKRIIVCADNMLTFHLRDGSSVNRQWQDRSRRESWTDEMREKARQKAFERGKDDA
ncbi:MAG: recombinase family protein [Lentisphaerae bacterium]|nr:recombinase family protein [Lentisphaerota bacterium]